VSLGRRGKGNSRGLLRVKSGRGGHNDEDFGMMRGEESWEGDEVGRSSKVILLYARKSDHLTNFRRITSGRVPNNKASSPC